MASLGRVLVAHPKLGGHFNTGHSWTGQNPHDAIGGAGRNAARPEVVADAGGHRIERDCASAIRHAFANELGGQVRQAVGLASAHDGRGALALLLDGRRAAVTFSFSIVRPSRT